MIIRNDSVMMMIRSGEDFNQQHPSFVVSAAAVALLCPKLVKTVAENERE